MKRYSFPLAGVARVRRIERDRAAFAAAEAARAAARAELELEAERTRYSQSMVPSGVRTVDEHLAARFTQELAAERVQVAGQRAASAALALTASRAALAGAVANVRALEELEARQRADHALEQRREEAKIVDDLVNTSAAHRAEPPSDDRS